MPAVCYHKTEFFDPKKTKIISNVTRPAWAGFKTEEEGRAKICKFLW
jgi:hypothetical protein